MACMNVIKLPLQLIPGSCLIIGLYKLCKKSAVRPMFPIKVHPDKTGADMARVGLMQIPDVCTSADCNLFLEQINKMK